jgi:hypothetical protein
MSFKNKTMSWGNKLVVVFVAFAGLIGTLVYRSVTTKFDLVTKDYYKEELRYQEKIDGAANAAAAGPIELTQDAATVTLRLPAFFAGKAVAGEAWFYCKTNAVKDQRIPVTIENGTYSFGKSTLSKEKYELKLEITVAGKQYYYLQPITVD